VLTWFEDLTPDEAQRLFELLTKVEKRAREALRNG
jgi:diadenosine tetraphosphate (Ap4A) HIT family hydrolase